MDRIYNVWRQVQEAVFGRLAELMLIGATGLAIVEIFRRYVEGRTFYWGQDAVTYGMIGAAFLYFGVTQARRAHLVLSAVPAWLRRKGWLRTMYAIRVFGMLSSVLFLAGLVWWGWPGAERTRELGRLTESMLIPLWPFQYLLLLGAAGMAITMAFQLYRDIRGLLAKDPAVWDEGEEELEL